jgi:hypothetical protein
MSTPENAPRKKINPLSRRPKARRLVMAVRGAAGAGKSVFAASMAEAGLGRLCFFDTERKARLLPGADGSTFDAIEVKHPDELPEFIDWALDGEGRSQGYGCFALDSWAMYFGRKHRETLQAVRARTGDPTAQPTADELQSDQMLYQEVLRRLCVDSGKHVVITDQIGAKGREDREENELGRVLPMTTGGLEYFVDVMVELDMRQDGFEQVRVARVVKSNSPHFPVGLEVENPDFANFLARIDAGGPGPSPPRNRRRWTRRRARRRMTYRGARRPMRRPPARCWPICWTRPTSRASAARRSPARPATTAARATSTRSPPVKSAT